MFRVPKKLHCITNAFFVLSNFKKPEKSVNRFLYFEKDLSTSIDITGEYLKYNMSFAVKSSDSSKFVMLPSFFTT